MKLKQFLVLAFCLLSGLSLTAQDFPKSNIYLFDIRQEDGGKISFANPRYLTNFNPDGYNNDPSFFSNTELYISVKEPSAAQTDLYKLDLENGTKQQVTATAESEFAPSRMPEYYTFSAVRIEKDGRDDVLRLWQFPIDQLTNGKLVFKYITGIKEYMWLNSREIVAYKESEDPTTLSIINTNNDEITTIATNTGPCFVRMPNGNLAYVQKSRYDDWKIMEKNLFRRRDAARTIIETLPNAEHFAILPDGSFLMGKGSKLYRYNKFVDDNWKEVADLRFYEISNISRIVVSPDFKIVIVAD
jgi:hypothetical protein